MNTTKILSTVAAFAAPAALLAFPTISNLTVEQPAGSPVVSVSYMLSEKGIVTFDVEQDGVSIGGENVNFFAGDVNQMLEAGPHAFIWDAGKSWPGHTVGANGIAVRLKTWTAAHPPLYRIVTLGCSNNGCNEYYEDAAHVPYGITNDLYKTEKIAFRYIDMKGSDLHMGLNYMHGGSGYCSGANDPHTESLTNDLWYAVYEFTQRQNQVLTGEMHGPHAGNLAYATCPAENMSQFYMTGNSKNNNARFPTQFGANGVMTPLSNAAGTSYLTLPTEAEWTFAARGGKGNWIHGTLAYPISGEEATNMLDKVAWFDYNSEGTVHPVGLKEPNGYGLYDMLGNVVETLNNTWVEWMGYEHRFVYNSPDTHPYRGGSYCDKFKAANIHGRARNMGNDVGWISPPTDELKAAFGFRPVIVIMD